MILGFLQFLDNLNYGEENRCEHLKINLMYLTHGKIFRKTNKGNKITSWKDFNSTRESSCWQGFRLEFIYK